MKGVKRQNIAAYGGLIGSPLQNFNKSEPTYLTLF